MIKEKNILRKVIVQKLRLQNENKGERERKHKLTDEIKFIAISLQVNYYTAFYWYQNRYQPRGENKIKLPELYGCESTKFYTRCNKKRL